MHRTPTCCSSVLVGLARIADQIHTYASIVLCVLVPAVCEDHAVRPLAMCHTETQFVVPPRLQQSSTTTPPVHASGPLIDSRQWENLGFASIMDLAMTLSPSEAHVDVTTYSGPDLFPATQLSSS